MADSADAGAQRRAVIVGNSDGVGLALTRRLLTAGWTVAGVSRSGSDLSHERYSHDVADVTSADYPGVLADRVAALGGIGLCVYAAGIGEFLDVGDLSGQTRTLEVNLLGAARTAEVVVPGMVAAGAGHVIGLSSLADVTVSGEAPAYAASKAGLSAYFLGLALALRPRGVEVTTVRFGFVDTKMAKGLVKPLMISVDEAVEVLMDVVRTRRAVISYPRRMALEHVFGPLPLGGHDEQCPAVGSAERTGEAAAVDDDRLEHLAALPHAHAMLAVSGRACLAGRERWDRETLLRRGLQYVQDFPCSEPVGPVTASSRRPSCPA